MAAVISKPVLFAALFAAAASIYVWSSPETASAKTTGTAKKRVAKTKFDGWDFPPPEPSLPKPRAASRDVFLPKVKVQRIVRLPEAKDDLVSIPANLADGEGGWAYTGMAEVDGVRMALLENSGTRQSGYIREGEDWKKSHVVGITTACIVLSDERGVAQTIYRYNPNDPPKPKPLPDPGFRPLNPSGGPSGPIGAIRPIVSSSNVPPPIK